MYTIHEFLDYLTSIEDIDKRLILLTKEERNVLLNIRLRLIVTHFNIWISEEKELRYLYED
jgi:hypothetical protein